jgi:hypothetical protein
VLLDEGREHFTVRCQGSDSGFLVIAHEATVAFDIGTEDGGELTFKTLICHNGTFFFKVSNR